MTKKVVICHPLCHNINVWKLLVILVVIKLYGQIDTFKLLMCLTKSYLSGGLFKIPSRIGLDLGKKISTKIFSVFLSK